MTINSIFIFYTLAIGILLGLNTYGFTMLKSNPVVALFWEFLVILVIQSIWVYSNKQPMLSSATTKDAGWILLMAVTAVIKSYLFARAFQSHHFNPAIFSIANTTIASIVLVCIGYFFLHSPINSYNFIGLLLGISSIYLLNIK